MRNYCVIGAGILGLCTALNLAETKARVEVVERRGPFSGATSRSFAWANSNRKAPVSYHRLNVAGVEEHLKLQQRIASQDPWLVQSGSILFDTSSGQEETFTVRTEQVQTLGYPTQMLTRAEIEHLEPEVVWPNGVLSALFFPSEGHINVPLLQEQLVQACINRGVVFTSATVTEIVTQNGGCTVIAEDGSLGEYDSAVIAAGADSARIAEASGFHLPMADLGVVSETTHSFLGTSAETAVQLNHVVISNLLNVRPAWDGKLLVQVPPIEKRVTEGDSQEILASVKETMEDALKTFFGQSISIERVVRSARSLPEDGLPIVDSLDNNGRIYAVVSHSGMTLGPLLGRLTASEVDGALEPELEPFRLERFKTGTPTYQPTAFFVGKQ